MIGKVIEIAEQSRHLSVYRGFLEVRHEQEVLGKIPLDDIISVVISGHGCTHSSNLIAALAERDIPLVVCNRSYSPVAYLLPVEGHHLQSARVQAQANASTPLKGRLWKQLVQAKVRHQAFVLEQTGEPKVSSALLAMAKRVKSGDPNNIEAQAAQHYWPKLLGSNFKRDPKETNTNALLNYAYAIIRSSVARGVVAAGLHPSLGLHHIGPANPMCLVDDLMEPYRPIADLLIWLLIQRGCKKVDRSAKKIIAGLAVIDVPSEKGVTPLFQSAARQASSLSKAYLKEEKNLSLPSMPLPISIQTLASEWSIE